MTQDPGGQNQPVQPQTIGQVVQPISQVPATPPGAQPFVRHNTMAITSLAFGIIGFFGHVLLIGGFACGIIAVVTGFISRGRIRRSGEHGDTMALVGIILGFVHIVSGVLLTLLFGGLILAFLGLAASASGH